MGEDLLWTNGVTTSTRSDIALTQALDTDMYFLTQTQYGTQVMLPFHRVELTDMVRGIIDTMDKEELTAVVDQVIERKAEFD